MPVADTLEILKAHYKEDNGSLHCTRGPKLQCINGHELAKNFPYDSIWSYCCDCYTLSSSPTPAGVKADSDCSYCGRPTTRRFVCQRCTTMSFESDESKEPKFFNLRTNGIPIPSCPGCLEPSSETSILEHECAELGASYFTALEVCPFCHKSATTHKWLTPIPTSKNIPMSFDVQREGKLLVLHLQDLSGDAAKTVGSI